MNAHDLIPRDGEHAKGIIGTQIVLGRKRKPSQILYLPEISGMHASGVEGTAIMRHIGVGVVERRGQSLALECRERSERTIHTIDPPTVRENPRNSAMTVPLAETLTS